MTADQTIGQDAAAVFQALSLGETVDHVDDLMVAPKCLQNKVLALMDREIQEAKEGREGYIGIKINSLTDKRIIDKLIEASEAGVQIEMVIRGINCILSGIEGKTDHIRVISIVGRYLEHSRIYIFGTGEREQIYIASADYMTRNTLRRVEVAVPIKDEKLRDRLRRMFRIMLEDNVKARVQLPDGSYEHVKRPEGEEPLNSQEFFFEKAYEAVEC